MAEHYFTADPSSDDQRAEIRAEIWGHELALATASGVFAAGRLDKGTAVLFRMAQPPAGNSRFLDLGTGYGVIACALATALPEAEVWALDVNQRALALCAGNARRLGIEARVHPVTAEQVPGDLTFDEIWSNPPIHIGKQALHGLLTTWLSRLEPDGRAVLVVGRNLGADSLQRWLVQDGTRTCVRLGSAKGFRVLEVRQVAS